MAKAIPDTIQPHRVARGITRSQLAHAIGKSYKHLYAVERLQQSVAIEVLHRIARELDIDPAEIVAADGPKPTHPKPTHPTPTHPPRGEGEVAS